MATMTNLEINEFHHWARQYAEKHDLPSTFDVEIAIFNSIDNAGDVYPTKDEPKKAIFCAQRTFELYVENKVHSY